MMFANCRTLLLRRVCAVLVGLAPAIASANIPGGGNGDGPDVSLKDEGASVVLDNGIVAIRINKADASITTFNYQGIHLFGGGYKGGRFYWSWNAPAYGGPNGTSMSTIDPTSNHGDYAEVKIRSPWSGKAGEAAMDVDVYFSLRRGAHGYYAAAVLRHPAAYPRVDIGEWRSNAYISPMFDWLSVDALRQRQMPTVEDMAASVPVPGAPKEVTRLTTGLYAGAYECKYSYSADLGALNVWGWSSTTRRVGIWMTVPSHEYYNGGPMKRELTGHMTGALLNMLNGSHYSIGTQLILDAGQDFKKTYGPFFVYANRYAGAATDSTHQVTQALWRDAQAQADAERAAWPYAWFKNADYVQAAGRGTVSGVLKVNDPGNPAATPAGAWVGLAPDDGGTDFQLQGRTYQFWVKAGPDGRFSIPHVLPGVYQLLAFGAGNIGTFKRANLEVQAGKALDVGTVAWAPPRAAPTLWEIGRPDRDTQEFHDGAFNYSQWATYAQAEANSAVGLTYIVGKSDWRQDWRYAQFGAAPWTVHFSLATTPPRDAPASLYIALASAQVPLAIAVNGTPVATFKAPQLSHAPVRLGSHGAFAETRVELPAGLLQAGANTLSLSPVIAKGKSGTVQYDYLRLEAAGTTLAP